MRFLLKFFCTYNTDVVNECRIYFEFKLLGEIIPTRTDKFLSVFFNPCPSSSFLATFAGSWGGGILPQTYFEF